MRHSLSTATSQPPASSSSGPSGARVAAEAGPGEVVVSSTVKDLVAGSGIAFRDRGAAELKGVPSEWRLFAVESGCQGTVPHRGTVP